MKLIYSNKGAVAVEFSLVLAFILIPLFIGLVDAARMVNAQVMIDRAAREGGVCIMRGEPYEKAIQNVLSNANFDVTALAIEPITDGGTLFLKLTYTIPNFPIFDLYGAVFSEQITSYATYQVP